MLVFAFDRDWTVDVNPHPHHEAVPLEWVRHIAHETGHAVYAIGNQDLAEEAAIPGVVDIVGRHADDWDEWLGGKQPDGYYERFPDRRERLSLIADLHPDAEDYVVVDDLDLSDVEGWDHYHAWEFVPAVEQGDIDPGLPWVREPVPDGGFQTLAGIIPSDPEHLRTFLREQERTPAFEITYLDDGSERTRLCWDVSPWLGSYGRAVPPQLKCTPLDPTEDQFSVEALSVEQITIIRPPPEQYLDAAQTHAEEALALARVVEVHPEAVSVSSILALLDQSEADTARDQHALEALQLVAAMRPTDCTPAIPILRSILGRESEDEAETVLTVLGQLGQEDPGDIAPLAGEITPYLEAEDGAIGREATRCIAAVASEFPEDVVDTVTDLAQTVEERGEAFPHAVDALASIGGEDPRALDPAVLRLAEIVQDGEVADRTRLQATVALGQIASEKPSIGPDIIDAVVAVYDVDNYRLRNNAIALTFDLADIHTDIVEPYVDDIAPLLDVDDAYTRTNASGTLARVAEDFPAAVDHLTPRFIECLSDEDHRVRENACWVLGRLQAESAEAALVDCLEDDSQDAVRNRAAWALSEIDPV